MSDYTDTQESDGSNILNIPAESTARYRMIKSLLTQRFYISLALSFSVFINIILIWAHKL